MMQTEDQVDKTPFTAAHWLFFPAAAVHAAAVLPLSVYPLLRGRVLLPGLSHSMAHAHEMIFGFALAVISGFLLNRIPRRRLALLFSLWLGARISFLLLPGGLLNLLTNGAFATALALAATPQFFASAKKWRNQIFAPAVVMLCLAVILFHALEIHGADQWQRNVLAEAVILLALLMAFMGGRILAPAIAGHLQSQGHKLKAPVQPQLEAYLLGGLIAALMLRPLPKGERIAAVLLLLVGGLLLVRLLRWRLWLCRGRTDLLCLALGYAWLALGVILLGASYLGWGWTPTQAIHAITVGAVGTLTLTVMARTRTIKARRHPSQIPWLWLAALLISLAAVLRVLGVYSPAAILLAAVAWSGGFLLLFVILLCIRPQAR